MADSPALHRHKRRQLQCRVAGEAAKSGGGSGPRTSRGYCAAPRCAANSWSEGSVDVSLFSDARCLATDRSKLRAAVPNRSFISVMRETCLRAAVSFNLSGLAKQQAGRRQIVRIFLGYASEHVQTAWEVYWALKELGDGLWFDKESLVGGDDWDRERAAAQQQAQFVVHLISSEVFARAGVVNREIKQTLKLVEDQPIGPSYALFVRLDEVRARIDLLSIY